MKGGEPQRCLAWEHVTQLRYDSWRACYRLAGSSPASSVAELLHVFAFGRGVQAFEAQAREALGDTMVALAMQRAGQPRAKLMQMFGAAAPRAETGKAESRAS